MFRNINLRFTEVIIDGKTSHYYIQRKYSLILSCLYIYKSLTYVGVDQIGKELPLSTTYKFDTLEKALEFSKKKYGLKSITYTTRHLIVS